MSRDDGFPVMDISTSIVHDPKFRQLHRERPEHVAPAFLAYIAVLGESWKAGRRVSVTESWPTLLPFDPDVVASMVHVKLIDRAGLPPRKAWDGWFRPAIERRTKARERWARYNAQRNADTASLPRGSDVSTATSVPSVRPFLPTDRPSTARGEKHGQMTDGERRKRGLEPLSEVMARLGKS